MPAQEPQTDRGDKSKPILRADMPKKNLPQLTHNALEQEVIVLSATWEMIDNLANRDMLTVTEDFAAEETTYLVRVSTEAHKRLFLIQLCDFLSLPNEFLGLPKADTNGPESARTLLAYLDVIADKPQLGGDATNLKLAVRRLSDWFDTAALIKDVWLPTINLKTDVTVERIKLLKLCGNYQKHNFVRLNEMVVLVEKLLSKTHPDIDFSKAFLCLPELADWFCDVSNRYENTLVEQLNDVQWSIYQYLGPEYGRSFLPDSRRYKVPSACNSDLAKSLYWNLMNEMRDGPIISQFKTPSYLKHP